MPPKRTRSKSANEEDSKQHSQDGELKGSEQKLTRGNSITEASILSNTIPFSRITRDTDFNSDKMWKIITWNVDGLRSVVKNNEKSLHDFFHNENPDVVCMQETKLQANDTDFGKVDGYDFYDSCSATQKGYAGTRVYVKKGIEHSVSYGFNGNHHNDEGRVIVLHLPNNVTVVNTYVPNAGMKLERLQYRVKTWDPAMQTCLQNILKAGGEFVWTGDLNVAERDYDRFFTGSFNQMQKSPGFTPEERSSFRAMLKALDAKDAFRQLYPTAAHVYSYWSMRFGGLKAKNAGWRLDYFVLSKGILGKLVDTFMLPDVNGSDHCPAVLWLNK